MQRYTMSYKTKAGEWVEVNGVGKEVAEDIKRVQIELGATEVYVSEDLSRDWELPVWGFDVNGKRCVVGMKIASVKLGR